MREAFRLSGGKEKSFDWASALGASHAGRSSNQGLGFRVSGLGMTLLLVSGLGLRRIFWV